MPVVLKIRRRGPLSYRQGMLRGRVHVSTPQTRGVVADAVAAYWEAEQISTAPTLQSVADAEEHARAMLRLHAGVQTVPERDDGVSQAGDKKVAPSGSEPPMPWLKKGPTGEGYCRHCHFVVGTWRRKLIWHAGFWARYTGQADCKGPGREPTLSMVEPCPGSGHLPSPPPVNPWDPWHVNITKEQS